VRAGASRKTHRARFTWNPFYRSLEEPGLPAAPVLKLFYCDATAPWPHRFFSPHWTRWTHHRVWRKPAVRAGANRKTHKARFTWNPFYRSLEEPGLPAAPVLKLFYCDATAPWPHRFFSPHWTRWTHHRVWRKPAVRAGAFCFAGSNVQRPHRKAQGELSLAFWGQRLNGQSRGTTSFLVRQCV